MNYGTVRKRIKEKLEKYKGVSTHNSIKVLYNNIIYDSISKASKANNISDYYVIKHCKDENNNKCKFL